MELAVETDGVGFWVDAGALVVAALADVLEDESFSLPFFFSLSLTFDAGGGVTSSMSSSSSEGGGRGFALFAA